jgi:uncharacterized protein YecT (DUF1311 family)
MRRTITAVACAVVVLIVALLVIDHHGELATSTTTSTSLVSGTKQLVAPTIKESFTLLPCSKNSTIGLEGCAERRILTLDAKVNSLRHEIFSHLYNNAARNDFIVAENDWFTYRQVACVSESDVNEGGSIVPVDFAYCVIKLDQQHIVDLSALKSEYEHP